MLGATAFVSLVLFGGPSSRPRGALLIAAYIGVAVAFFIAGAVKGVIGQALPAQAAQDALHLAVACVHGMQYLLTWNCTHLANARLRSRIERVCRDAGYVPPIICTPEELEG